MNDELVVNAHVRVRWLVSDLELGAGIQGVSSETDALAAKVEGLGFDGVSTAPPDSDPFCCWRPSGRTTP